MKKGVSKVNHLLFMDDVKLYASKSDGIDSLVQTVRVCTQDLGMKFGIKKCAILVLKRGKNQQLRGNQSWKQRNNRRSGY